ncbi:hypothetical protein [Segetibacter aerophilus]|uniref:Uncharacterized protein n=1 Tax=Segetibacter aerophilus TaxID=670293 RepID=A0A512BD84_9BACT|nr:hypothetical protein [Segetibacter aerophilus]GEO09894.1 hypothetical protein SAE01_23900 [Segetibacter aerophilus]
MKHFLCLTLVVLLAFGTANAQGRKPPNTPLPPKGPRGNHSNGNGPNNPPPGHSGQTSVIFSAVGFDDQSPTLEGVAATRETSINTANNQSLISEMRKNVAPLVMGSNFMTPSGWGSTGTFAFGAISGTPYQTYASTQRQNSDFLAQVGFGAGNAQKSVSVVGIVNVNDVSKVDNFSYSFIASRQLGKFSSISAGALHLFADPNKTDAGESFYVAFSQAIKKTKFSYSVGIGTGRFYDNNEIDKEEGKADHGTAVFANLSYNILKNVAVSTEWTGRNIAFSSTLMIKPNLPVLAIGVSDVTRLSGDHPTFFASIGKAISFHRGRR